MFLMVIVLKKLLIAINDDSILKNKFKIETALCLFLNSAETLGSIIGSQYFGLLSKYSHWTTSGAQQFSYKLLSLINFK